ncbi:MAG: universal stress protein [Planctomycetaceae bacterium]|nr:universal stress protein [Planctomycetaceae bacterium]
MSSFRRILVGIDVVDGELPAATRQAFESAVKLAAVDHSVELILLTVTNAPVADTEAFLTAEENAVGTQGTLARIQSELVDQAKEAGVAASTRLAFGKSWYEIIREVIKSDCDLVVVGTRGKGTAERVLFGSTSMKLLRKCPCPVWVTRPEPDGEIPVVLAADDFSRTGESVLEIGVHLARAMEGRFLAMHCTPSIKENALLRTGVSDTDVAAQRAAIREEAEQQLTNRLAHLDVRTISGGTKIRVVAGAADLAIEEAVREEHVSLVVMGTLGRAGIPGLLLGNTAERLLPLLSCSVLAVKPEGFVSPVQVDE